MLGSFVENFRVESLKHLNYYAKFVGANKAGLLTRNCSQLISVAANY